MSNLEVMNKLLDCAQTFIDPVCRAFINPGPNAPHDVCSCEGTGDGQLWVGNIDSLAGWPPTAAPNMNCNMFFTEQIELGIVRCAKSVLVDVDYFPTEADMFADTEQQQTDKDALKKAILCCWGVDGRDILPPIWEPIPPQGGCVGGIWTMFIRGQ